MKQMGNTRLTKEQFYANGGFSNPRQFRTMIDGVWTYWANA